MKNPVPLSITDNLTNLDFSLDDEDVDKYLKGYGKNYLLGSAEKRFQVLRNTLKDPMIWFLFFASFLFLLSGEFTEASILLLASFPIIALDSFLHRRTALSTASLVNNLSVSSDVIRRGIKTTISSEDLVPRDLISIDIGEYIPADCLLVGGNAVQVDESSLSGEVEAIVKYPLVELPLPYNQEILVDHCHWLFAGCRLVSGTALARVIYTGSSTLYGDLIRTARGEKSEPTILQKSISKLILRMLALSTLLCALLASVRILRGYSYTDALMSAAVLALAALPEEFPIVFSFYLGYSIYRLSRHKVLVRHAAGVEHIGRVSVICSDKTGTITEGVLRLDHIENLAGFSKDDVLHIARMASQNRSMDPVDLAIRMKKPEIQALEVLDVTPFNETNKYESITYKDKDGHFIIVTKGAPERLIEQSELSDRQKKATLASINQYASQGYKVIGCSVQRDLNNAFVKDKAKFCGFLCFKDAVKKNVISSIKACQKMGVRVIMVTGDHYQTAQNIGEQIGIFRPGFHKGISADAVDVDWQKVVRDEKISVIARALPRQKYEIVKALKSQDKIVAVTGDGVNDILALKASDVSLVMGERGTRGARDIASMVLMDDNFTTVTQAVLEGRRLFRNLKKSFMYLIIIHIPLVLSSAILPALGYPIVFLPIHVVLLEIILHPTSLLCFHDESMEEYGQERDVQKFTARHVFFSKNEIFKIIFTGMLLTSLVFILYQHAYRFDDIVYARSLAFYLIAVLSISLSFGLSNKVSKNTMFITLAILTIVGLCHLYPGFAYYLELTGIGPADWAIIAAGNLFVFLYVKGFSKLRKSVILKVLKVG